MQLGQRPIARTRGTRASAGLPACPELAHSHLIFACCGIAAVAPQEPGRTLFCCYLQFLLQVCSESGSGLTCGSRLGTAGAGVHAVGPIDGRPSVSQGDEAKR